MLGPERIAELLQMDQNEKSQLKRNERSFVRQVRQCEEECKFNDNFSLIDFSIRATSGLTDDVERAYFEARQDLTVWANIREGNTLLIEKSEDESKFKNVMTLRQGLPKFYLLNFDVVQENKRKLLAREPIEQFF